MRNPAGHQIHQPCFIHRPVDPIIAIAGLWSLWIKPNGESVLSYALLTKSAAPSLQHTHHRIPVGLAPENLGNGYPRPYAEKLWTT
ncbi:SOS response-associated peptidase family protein [Pseudomonas sp. QE6]|uniref:SOS response-associated peptidase family protein n=1 Tax=Pseudomonas sp. QE6 TaxID=3242491 RepID=UPI003527DCE3